MTPLPKMVNRMGLTVHVVETKFFIAKKDKLPALAAMVEATKAEVEERGRISYDVTLDDIQSCESLKEALEVFGWEIKTDADRNYVDIDYEQEKIAEDFYLYALGPFVKKGSYIVMTADEGYRYRYFFDGKECREQVAKFTYEDVK